MRHPNFDTFISLMLLITWLMHPSVLAQDGTASTSSAPTYQAQTIQDPATNQAALKIQALPLEKEELLI